MGDLIVLGLPGEDVLADCAASASTGAQARQRPPDTGRNRTAGTHLSQGNAELSINGICPVTNGMVTRMSAASFARTCEAKLGRRAKVVGRLARGGIGIKFIAPQWRRCEMCKGRQDNWPPELEIININVEATMATKAETEALAKLKLECAKMEEERDKALARVAGLEASLKERDKQIDASIAHADLQQTRAMEAEEQLAEAKIRIAKLETELATAKTAVPPEISLPHMSVNMYHDALAEFGLRVLQGGVAVVFRGTQP